MNKAILFDPETNESKFVEVSNFRDIQNKIGCDYFTCINTSPEGDTGETIYCDDEGLINGTAFGTKFLGFDNVIFGKLLFLGTAEDGSSVDTCLELDDIMEMVDYTMERMSV